MDPNTPQHQSGEGASTVLKKKEHTGHRNSSSLVLQAEMPRLRCFICNHRLLWRAALKAIILPSKGKESPCQSLCTNKLLPSHPLLPSHSSASQAFKFHRCSLGTVLQGPGSLLTVVSTLDYAHQVYTFR